MKRFLASLALVTFSLLAPALRADTLPTLTVAGSAGTLIETPVIGGESYLYEDLHTDLLGTTNQTFLATFTDIAGVKLLNVTDVCANVAILVRPQPCEALAFSFTDLGLGDATVLQTLGLVGVNLGGNALGINFDASIGGGSAKIGFSDPTPPSATPEPGSLTLLGSGMLGVAGVVRRRLVS